MKNQRLALIYGLLAVLCWSTVASAFKISLKYLNYLQLLFFAAIVSTLVLFSVLTLQRKLYLLRTFSYHEWLQSALLGFLNPFLYYVVLFKAYEILPAQEALTLNYTWAIMLVLLSIPLLKQKVTLRSILAIVISFFGVVIIATRGNLFSFSFANPLGTSLALGSSVIWALFWIFNTKDKRDEVAKLFLNFFFGSIYTTIIALCYSKIHLPVLPGLIGVTYVGLFEMGITFVLWLKALQLAKTTASVSNLIFLSPFLSMLFISLIVGEKILLSSIIGMCFIIGGILIQQWKN